MATAKQIEAKLLRILKERISDDHPMRLRVVRFFAEARSHVLQVMVVHVLVIYLLNNSGFIRLK